MLTAQDKVQLLRIRVKVNNKLTVTAQEKQWIINLYVKVRKAVPIGQAMIAQAQGFCIEGLVTHH